MNQIFEPEYGISSGRNIYLGINEDKSLQTMCNSTGTVTAFVVNGNLWSYHPNRDKFNKVFLLMKRPRTVSGKTTEITE